MRLIKNISVSDFRSLENCILDDASDLNVIVGRNSSGKSNLLRALSIFFNNEVEPGKPMVFSRDHFERVPRSRKKKSISISVMFELPSTFHYRKEMLPLKSIGTSFVIVRTWELGRLRTPINTIHIEKDSVVVPDSSDLARQFLGLIFFRYIPNRSIPSQLLAQESKEIADSIFMRMKGDKHAAALLSQLIAATKRLLSHASDSLDSAESPLTRPALAMPSSLGEMLTMTGFQASGSHGGIVQDEDWGSGHQSFFLYHVLHALDTNYARFFGWRQAVIWGVEEPESALHRDLENRLAEHLREWSHNRDSKLQIFQTTHSSVFTMAADMGYWAELSDGATGLDALPIQTLTREAETRGVSGWVHPVLSFPWNPVVLVEGSIDMEVLTHVASIAGFEHIKFFTVPRFDASESDNGKDAIISYLRRHGGLARHRPRSAPLIVVFDWDVTASDLKKAKSAYGDESERYVLQMDTKHCDNNLGPDFRGIERFYPSSIVREAHHANELIIGVTDGQPYSISKSQLDRGKGKLLDRVRKVLSKDDLVPLIKVLVDIERVVRRDSVVQITLPGFENEMDGK